MRIPRKLVRQIDTHRLIPSKYVPPHGDSVLMAIADNQRHLREITELDDITNDRLRAERDHLTGISAKELVYDIPEAKIINASFCHAHPQGSRFNRDDRGAWYAGFSLNTAKKEIVYHKTLQLLEIGVLEDEITYIDYLADFDGYFHDLRDRRRYARFLAPDSYEASQHLASELLDAGSLGVVYPSVRDRRGICIACFRPAAVNNVRKGTKWEFKWEGTERPLIRQVK